jgi:hypothetical protein
VTALFLVSLSGSSDAQGEDGRQEGSDPGLPQSPQMPPGPSRLRGGSGGLPGGKVGGTGTDPCCASPVHCGTVASTHTALTVPCCMFCPSPGLPCVAPMSLASPSDLSAFLLTRRLLVLQRRCLMVAHLVLTRHWLRCGPPCCGGSAVLTSDPGLLQSSLSWHFLNRV